MAPFIKREMRCWISYGLDLLCTARLPAVTATFLSGVSITAKTEHFKNYRCNRSFKDAAFCDSYVVPLQVNLNFTTM